MHKTTQTSRKKWDEEATSTNTRSLPVKATRGLSRDEPRTNGLDHSWRDGNHKDSREVLSKPATRALTNQESSRESQLQRRQGRVTLSLPVILFSTLVLVSTASFILSHGLSIFRCPETAQQPVQSLNCSQQNLQQLPQRVLRQESNEQTNSTESPPENVTPATPCPEGDPACFTERFADENERNNPLKSEVPLDVLNILRNPWATPTVPVIQVFLPFKTDLCEGFLLRTLKQARSRNSVVYLIGDDKYKYMAKENGIILEPYSNYGNIVDWFDRNYGNLLPSGAPLNAAGWNVKFFVMKLFMERHRVPRMFFIDSDVMLFANVTEMVAQHYDRVPLALGYRWPSLQYRGPRHVASVSASTHVSIWTYDALCDFLEFFDAFFQEKVLPRYSLDGQMISKGPYNDMTLLGWYTFRDCWQRRYQDVHPPCLSDTENGFTPQRTAKLRGKAFPKYPVVSLNQQRWCKNTSWSSEGWCVFDNNFAARESDNDPSGTTPKVCFKYKQSEGMKAPVSDVYTYFQDWSEDGRKQDKPVQFLGVHFQGRKKCLLEPWEKDSQTWACG